MDAVVFVAFRLAVERLIPVGKLVVLEREIFRGALAIKEDCQERRANFILPSGHRFFTST
jgi:guanylate kinase